MHDWQDSAKPGFGLNVWFLVGGPQADRPKSTSWEQCCHTSVVWANEDI
jgi:hypothetical protein